MYGRIQTKKRVVMKMNWIDGISDAIDYIEKNITEDITIEEISRQAYVSPVYFQKGFSMLCGFTVGEYIRKRRLALAGTELISTDNRIIDIALKYGYDSPDSFTKAFVRFHGTTPTAVRKEGAVIKSFAPLTIKFTLKGGYTMDYRIVEKEAFTVMGISKMFRYDNSLEEIPKFWDEYCKGGENKAVCGMYGICVDDNIGENGKPEQEQFEYLIADNYIPWNEVPDGCVTRVIPKHTWAVFSCRGAMPKSLQEVDRKIFSEWLPNCREYEIADGYSVEMYTDVNEYPDGNQDKNYYSEIWIPLKRK